MFSSAPPSPLSPLFVISPEPLIISDICKLFCSPNYRPRTRADDGNRARRGAHFLPQLGIHNERGRKQGARRAENEFKRRAIIAPSSLRRQTVRKLGNQSKHIAPSPGAARGAPLCAPDAAFQTSNPLVGSGDRGRTRESEPFGQKSLRGERGRPL